MHLLRETDSRLDPLLICMVQATGCTIKPSSPELLALIRQEVDSIKAAAPSAGQTGAAGGIPAASATSRPDSERGGSLHPDVRDDVRAMLRAGGFKPSGRSKPASEYLAQAAREDRFPSINSAVDVNNYLSLLSGLPVSLLEASAFSGDIARLRICAAGESYVFNAAGQEMDLAGLACICDDAGKPLGNAVKDSMAAKLGPDSQNLFGFIYAPRSCFDSSRLEQLGKRFADLLREHCAAQSAKVLVVG
ncbi:MAG: hypothetical protein KKI09_07445 [Spirochaetes bacterium]|nr:hypothetical protein [Spirochaetota bacterium]MBU0955246.1 hypothetical protein [Spirochaetota bacterium]